MTKIPVNKMSVDDAKALINLDKELIGKVIGQDAAVIKIAKSIKRNRLGIKDPNRPIGSFVFLGSTGVGKTHLAKQLAKEMFGSEDSLIRVLPEVKKIITNWPLLATDYLGNSNLICAQVIDQWNQN
jgi:ATP-dependent Clp protease ATP-binding subunit ClpC